LPLAAAATNSPLHCHLQLPQGSLPASSASLPGLLHHNSLCCQAASQVPCSAAVLGPVCNNNSAMVEKFGWEQRNHTRSSVGLAAGGAVASHQWCLALHACVYQLRSLNCNMPLLP
jgi:hypothetical protein